MIDPYSSYSRYLQFGVFSIGRPTFLHHVIKSPAKTEPSTLDDVIKVLANQAAESGLEGPGTDHPRPYDMDYYDSIKKEYPYLLCVIGNEVVYLKVSDRCLNCSKLWMAFNWIISCELG